MKSFYPFVVLLAILPNHLIKAAFNGCDFNSSGVFSHPGTLHTECDFNRMKEKVSAGSHPWIDGWQRLITNGRSSLNYQARPQAVVYRGFDGTHMQNYGILYNDVAAAYALALRWKVSGNVSYSAHGRQILDGWASSLNKIEGTSDKFLASGIYGYQLAVAGEILSTDPLWNETALTAFKTMMLNVFYPMNHDFLIRHNGAKIDHYWANWDLANMNAMIAIGVLTDRHDIYQEAIDYFFNGNGNGAVNQLFTAVFPEENLAQTQESGRDQGHNTLVIALLGSFCQIAYNQGCDLFAYRDSIVLKGAEYVAKYNQGQDVPFKPYTNSDVSHPVISNASRGSIRPEWELFYNHYVVKKNETAPFVKSFANLTRPEGGGGDYGPNSGGFDQLGYGTLTYTL